MTISANDSTLSYVSNGVATVFTGPTTPNASYIQVYFVDPVYGASTLQTSGYTLTGVGGAGPTTVTFAVAPVTGTTINIERVVPYLQTTSITNLGKFLPQSIEQGLDAIVMQTQQIAGQVGVLLNTNPDAQAIASAAAAATSAASAGASAGTAGSNATVATTQAAAATSAATSATTSAATATTQATNAATSATNAAASATAATTAATSGPVLGYTTQALMNADLAHAAGSLALVTNDPTPANNGTYIKSGASGSGAWTQSADRVSTLTAFQSDLDSYALNIEQSTNLYNSATAIAGQYLSTVNGVISAASGWTVSAFIPVTAGTQYTISVNASKQNGCAFYSTNAANGSGYISGSLNTTTISQGNPLTLTAPTGAQYFAMNVGSPSYAQPSQIQFQAGATATTYSAWHAARRVVYGTAVRGDVVMPILDAQVTSIQNNVNSNNASLNGSFITGLGEVFPSPAKLRNLEAWWDANDLTTLFQDTGGTIPVTGAGQTVGLMKDKSGNGLHLQQATVALRPTLQQDATGVYYLQGTGASVQMTVPGSASAGSFNFLHNGTGASWGCAVAMENPITATETRCVWHTNQATTLAGAAFEMVTSSSLGSSTVRIGNGSAYVINGGGYYQSARVDGIPQHFIATYQSSTAILPYNFYHYMDGSLDPNSGATQSNAPTSANAYNDFTLFSSVSGIQFNGKFYSLVMSATVWTEAERRAVGRYLMSHWNTAGYVLGVGDSLTFNSSYGQVIRNFYPAVLESLLLADGFARTSINKGVSGNSSLNVIGRLPNVLQAGSGDVAVIYIGTNDVGLIGTTSVQASPTPTATTFGVATGVGIKYSPGGFLTVGGVEAVISSVSGDVLTLSAPLPSAPSVGAAVVPDTTSNIIAIGRALREAGFKRLLVGGMHYLNFATGGDTVSTPLQQNVALRALQQAAANTLGVPFVDFHAYMQALIVAGTYTQGNDLAWHVAVGNQHLNNTGETILANAIYAAMQSAGWA